MKTIKHFNVGDRVFDIKRNLCGIVFMVQEHAIQVAFLENIRNVASELSYQDCFEEHELARLEFIDNSGKIESE